MIDEAQRTLDLSALEELRMLSNINSDGAQLLQSFWWASRSCGRCCSGRSWCNLRSVLRRTSTWAPSIWRRRRSIHHRVALCGGREHLFSKEAAHLIANASSGIPRVINAVCDAALITIRLRAARKENYNKHSPGSLGRPARQVRACAPAVGGAAQTGQAAPRRDKK